MNNFINLKKNVLYLIDKKQFNEALELLEEFPFVDSCDYYTLLGRCLLVSEKYDNQLERAEIAFKNSLSINEFYIPALVELGYLYYSVYDKPLEGFKFFEKSLNLAKDFMFDSLEGLLKCINETKGIKLSLDISSQFKKEILNGINDINNEI